MSRAQALRVRRVIAAMAIGLVVGVPAGVGLDVARDAWQGHRRSVEWAEQCEQDGGQMVTLPAPNGDRTGPVCWGSTPPIAEETR